MTLLLWHPGRVGMAAAPMAGRGSRQSEEDGEQETGENYLFIIICL